MRRSQLRPRNVGSRAERGRAAGEPEHRARSPARAGVIQSTSTPNATCDPAPLAPRSPSADPEGVTPVTPRSAVCIHTSKGRIRPRAVTLSISPNFRHQVLNYHRQTSQIQ